MQFELGYAGEDNVAFFIGYVEASHTVDEAQQRLFCRELNASLNGDLPLSLRHPTLVDVLAQYTAKTGLKFVVPSGVDYTTTKVPYFQTMGTGVLGMAYVGDVFGIENMLWQQQTDGQVFVGAWADSRWAKTSLTLAEKWFSKVGSDGGKEVPVMPLIRPGVVLNGSKLKQVELRGHKMVVKWND